MINICISESCGSNGFKCPKSICFRAYTASAKGARKSSFCLSFNHFITFVLFLSAILKIYAVSFINVSQALITKFGRMSSETEGRAKREKIEERRGVKSTSRDGLLTNGYALFGFGFRVMLVTQSQPEIHKNFI